MAFWTNTGLSRALDRYFRDSTPPGFFYLALVTDSPAPSSATQTMADLTEIAAGNGYSSGGIPLSTAPFPVITQAAANSDAELRDIILAASGGDIPPSGDGARYAVLTDDNGTVANREVFFVWDLATDRVVDDGGSMTLEDAILSLEQPFPAPSDPHFVTNRGLYLILSHFLRNSPEPAKFYLALLNDDVEPDYVNNTLGDDAWEIADGNGYTEGGKEVGRNTTDFPTLTLDQMNELASVTLKDIDFTASGGSIGPAYRCALVTDEETPANRNLIAVWDFGGNYTVNSGETLRLRNLTITITHL